MANRYVALEEIDYDQLMLGKAKSKVSSTNSCHSPVSLLLLCCRCVCRAGGDLAAEIVQSIPAHLAPILLREAVQLSQASAIAAIIANWPLSVLRYCVTSHQTVIFPSHQCPIIPWSLCS